MKVLQRAVYDPMYPDSDGKPLADNDVQWEWIVLIKQNLLRLFDKQEDVAISADMLIYTVEGDPSESIAPDVFMAFGRPRMERFSYIVFREANIFPQVIFEVLSRGNRRAERAYKLEFYEKQRVEEYFEIDPLRHELKIYTWQSTRLVEVEDPFEYTSTRLGIRFVRDDIGKLAVLGPDEKLFLNYNQLMAEGTEYLHRAEEAEERAEEAEVQIAAERKKAQAERTKAETQRIKAEAERIAKEKLAAKLRELGLDPDAI